MPGKPLTNPAPAAILIFSLICLIFSCRKEDIISSNPAFMLRFSTSALSFDTVFTATSSIVKTITLYNDQSSALEISSISLKGNNSPGNSSYIFSAGGKTGPLVTNLKLAGKDSIILLIRVVIPASQQPGPFRVSDSLLVVTNGNHQEINLNSYGQNANRVTDTLIQADTHWNAILPYLIEKSITVAAGTVLRIDAGSRIYFHGLSGLHIKGTLLANGQLNYPVSFLSDRLEPLYSTVAGQWEGITIEQGSLGNQLLYTSLLNAVTGISLNGMPGSTALQATISNSSIGNMTADGIRFTNSRLKILNSLIFYCQNYLLNGAGDSYLTAEQNSFYNSNQFFFHAVPSISVSLTGPADSVSFLNNIVFGTLQNEIQVGGATGVNIQGNLLTSLSLMSSYTNNIFNTDPLYSQVASYNFHLGGIISPAYKKGVVIQANNADALILFYDPDGVKRNSPPTIGAYEVN